MKKRFEYIGLTGTNGAGKGEVANFFRYHGYHYFSLSDIIRDELARRGEDINRDNLIRAGNELRTTHGPDVLARRVGEKLQPPAIIDSIRNLHEVEYFRRLREFILIGVDAPVAIRHRRVLKRGRNESAQTLEEFQKKEAEERDGGENGQQLKACLEAADVLIWNDGSLDELHRKLEDLLT